MNLTIAYLYYNLLNLYGENGNIKILKKALENQGINVMIKFLDVTDKLDFNNYDLIYMGSGNYEALELIINELKKYKKDIKKYIENNKYFLITGNSIDIFGKYILKDGKKINGLDIFDYYIKIEDISIIDKALFKTKLIEEKIIGFERRNSLMFNNNYDFFDVIDGASKNILVEKEGVKYKNFYATYLIGPFLIRNPFFLEYFIKSLVLNKNKDFKFKEFNLNFEKQAYNNYLSYNYGIIKSE